MVVNDPWYDALQAVQPVWEAIQPLIITGFTAGVVFAIVFGAIKIGWKFAPYVFIGAMLVWLLSFLD